MKALFSTSPSRNWKDPDEKTDKWKVKIEEQSRKEEDVSQPSINLGLGIGGPTTSSSDPESDQYHRLNNNSNSFSNDDSRIVKVEVADDDQVVENEREKLRSMKCSVVCFTEEQLQEFNTQSLIFKYVISGSPVPVQLLLPLWTSFSSPSYPRVSPLLLGFCRLGFDNQYEMDPEPGRCRRTDGKKWRCHQSVVPNEKYCERHMHRGRKRSRKLVESSSGAAPSQSGTRNIVNTSSNNNKPNNDFRSKFPSNQEQNSHLSTFNNPISSHTSARCNTEDKNGPAQVLTGCNVGKHNSIRMERLASSNISSGLDFSPKSVLQGGQKCLRVESCNINPNSDPGRCRRTDGKKWRCSNRVLPDQKYCAHHMNRGAKKPTAVTLSNSGVSIAAYKCASMAKFNGPGWAEMGRGVDTNLDFSLSSSSANHGGKVEDNHGVGGDGRSGSTSETTVTDDSIDVSNMITLSP